MTPLAGGTAMTCWRMTFSGNRVAEFREYCDTHHAHAVLFEN